MAKDAKGHGSNGGGMGHAEHFAEAQRLLKVRAGLLKDGKHREAADTMAKAKEHADTSLHLRTQERRVASGQTMKQRMAAGTAPALGKTSKAINARGDTFNPKKGR